ncbi:MAG: hypothetical protein KDD19_29670 [Phaeodactylibacter sp.]|nr:hypothetical protein [Phaeodactylibacter sp.]MCB9048841.1 hypothetical protein [Lewinellaceae bacterium]
MFTNQSGAVRIGIAVNSSGAPGASSIEEQYTTSNEVFNEIADVLRQHDAEVFKIEANGALVEQLSTLAPSVDLIFNMAEDLYQVALPMAVQQVQLELAPMPLACTGATVEGHILALNKALARQVLGNRVAQPDWWYLDDAEMMQTEDISFPVIIKPATEGHSLGVHQDNVVYSMAELEQAYRRLRKRFKGKLLIESFLDGVEYSIGLVGNVILPAVAWDLSQMPGQPLVRGEELKQQDLTIPHATLITEHALLESLATQAATAHIELGLQDYSRSDFRSRKGSFVPCYLETNSMPGLENLQSVLPWAAANAGVTYPELIGSIVAQALKRLPDEYREQLHTQKFEASYRQLELRASEGKRITVSGREFRLLEPTQEDTLVAAPLGKELAGQM